MKKHLFNATLLWAFLSLALCTAGCSDDDGYPDVDGQSPSITLTADHIQTATGRTFTLEGTIADADGISTIRLQCAELSLNKTIDLIEIYEKPLTTYDLSYDFQIQPNEIGEQFTVKVTVTDVGGRSVSQDVLVTLDGDFEVPVFVIAPANGSMVTALLRDGETPQFDLTISVTDDRSLDYLILNIEGIDDYTNHRVEADGSKAFEKTFKITMPAEKKDYPMTISAFDKSGKSSSIECIVSVTDVQDFDKMYLADVATEAELNSDVFGVPMRIDHVGEYQYQALYYNRSDNTKIFFLPQKTSFSPVCYGLDPENEEMLTDDPSAAKPIVLTQANMYYKINIDILQKTYKIEMYSVEDATDPWPASMIYGMPTMDKWNDGGSTMMDFTFGMTSTNPTEVVSLKQDATNPHLFYYDPMTLTGGESMNFILHNYHTDQWWNFVRWCSDTEEDPEVFGYYTGSTFKNKDFTGPTTTQDVWSKPRVITSGSYQFWFDSHLGRAKLVRVN